MSIFWLGISKSLAETYQRINTECMESIKQVVDFDAPAHAVYEALTDADITAEFTEAPAEIEPVKGGKYSAFGGDLAGEFTRLVPDELLAMRWRAVMEGWPDDHYSVVTIELFQSSDGTELQFMQTDIPAPCVDDIAEGWMDYFWEPMQKHFAW